MHKRRVVIIGIDGIPFEVMHDLSENGVMPNFKRLRDKGTFEKMRSTIPDISSIAWASVITGKNAGEHGIYGFVDLIEGTYSLRFPNFKSLKEKPFWHEDGGKYVIINVPSTYPAEELNGLLVSGFVAIDLDKAVYPKDYLTKLENISYAIDADSSLAHQSKDMFLDDLFLTLEKRMKLRKQAWNELDWDVFMFVITGTDRLGHFMWDSYDDKNDKHHDSVMNFFRKVDDAIGEILSNMRESDGLIMLSDHGMERIKMNFFVNAFLKEKGFLKLGDEEEKSYNNILEGTKAFCLDPGRIYLHRKGKYPKGSVRTEEEKEIIEEIVKELEKIEFKGEKVIKKVYRREDIYHGPLTDQAPDLVLEGNSGFSIRGSISNREIFGEEIFTGKHTLENAFIYINTKKEGIIPNNSTLEDVKNILRKMREE